jgi:hypothetical protein
MPEIHLILFKMDHIKRWIEIIYMKRWTTLLYLIVTILTTLAITSCNISNKSQAVDTNTKQSGIISGTINSEAENRPDSSTSNEAYNSSDIKIVSSELNVKNARLGYEVKITYPQIGNPRRPQERKFNSYVRRLIANDVKDFKEFCLKNRKYPNGGKRRIDYYLGAHFEILYATSELLSIKLTIESYTGYLNSDWFPLPLNYNLKDGRPIKNLSELFKPKSKYLESISNYCVSELVKRGLNCGGGGIGNEEWLRRGTEPKIENYRGWNLTKDGIQITFGEYQVGPGCLGLVSVVVPYNHLHEILRQEIKKEV